MNRTDFLERLRVIIEQENIQVLKNQTENIGKAISEKHTIDIAVLGEFKVGKSSFINNFLGMNILPTGVIPVTSVITSIRHQDQESATVYFFDGHKERIEIENVGLFVNESNNPDNNKQVEFVDVTLPQLGFLNGLHIVDTPGLGSFWKHNTETTRQWFGRVGVAIVAISTERPLSEDEINLIKDIKDETPEVIILLTKTDLFANKEVDEIESFIKKSLKRKLDSDFRIFKYSLKKNSESYKNHIIKNLLEPLTYDFDSKRENILNHKLKSLASHCIAFLNIARISSLHSDEERKKLKKVIFDKKINQNFVAHEMALVLSDELNGIRDRVFDVLESEKDAVIKKLKTKFEADYPVWKGNLYLRTRKFESWMTEELGKEFSYLADKNRIEFGNIVQAAGEHFEFFASSFRNSLKDKIKNILHTEMPVEELDIRFDALRKPDIRISWTFESHIDLLWFLFPMVIFGKMFGRYFEKNIGREVEINIYRLTSSITALISKSIRSIKDQTQLYITDELNTIENILTNTPSKSEYYEDMIEELRKLG